MEETALQPAIKSALKVTKDAAIKSIKRLTVDSPRGKLWRRIRNCSTEALTAGTT